MFRLVRSLSPKRRSLPETPAPSPCDGAEELSRLYAALSPDDRTVLLHLARKLADTP